MVTCATFSDNIDDDFYLSAHEFFAAHRLQGLTYDDVLLATQFSEVLPRDTSLTSSLSDQLNLPTPILSSDMDTVTEHEMAMAMAAQGGMGVIHYNMTEAEQVEQLQRVKNTDPEQKQPSNNTQGQGAPWQQSSLDDQGRFVCGVAVSAARDQAGALDKERLIAHVGRLVTAGVDAIAISTAHGFSRGVGDTVQLLRATFPKLTLIAGNVASAAGVAFLADAGANAIKVGQGPGSICTTRIVAGVGIPQMTALFVAAQAARKKGVRIIADGGISKSGDIVKALTLADAVMCGGLLASCREAPGELVQVAGKTYKQYRGMGSMAAMQAGSAARYGHASKDIHRKASAEGVEGLKAVTGSVVDTLTQLRGGVQSGMGYLGAKTLPELKQRARFIRATVAGQRESAPHNIITRSSVSQEASCAYG